MTRGKGGLLAALRHRDYRLLISAFTISDIGTWMYNIALAVWVYDATGSLGWVAATTVARFVPALVFSTYAGVIADRFDRRLVMIAADLMFAALMVALGVAMALDAAPALVVAIAACSSTLGTVYGPAAAALTPRVVPARELASANALRNTVDNLTVVAGPALGALLTLAGPPQVVVWINALTFLGSALLLLGLRTRAPGADVTDGGEHGVLRQMAVGVRTIVADRGVLVLVAYSVVATGIFGADTVFFIAASDELLGTGPDGYGYLLAGLGVGGLLAAPLVTRAERLPKLAPVIIAGMAFYCLPTMVLLVFDQPAVAFVVQVMRGAGTLFVDVLAVTALQRAIAPEVMARVFAVFDSLCLAAILVGATLTSWIIGAGGAEAGVWLTGAAAFAISLAGLPWLIGVDRVAAARRAALAPRIAIIEACGLFDLVPEGGLLELAAQAEETTLRVDDVAVREGDVADAFYIVMAGTLGVHGAGLEVPDVGPGDWFGEIGLIEQIPRTATVTAKTAVVLLRIDGTAFLEALTSGRPSAAILDGSAARLRRTHPTTAATLRGLDAAAPR